MAGDEAPPSSSGRALPQHLHFRSGRYYFAKRDPTTKKVRWTALSKDLAVALHQHRLLLAGNPGEAFTERGAPGYWLSNIAKDILAQSRKRARQDDIMFTLTVEDVVAIGLASNWRCAVTGVRLRPDRVEGSAMRPFMPSIDRIDPRRGYERSNCRLVCVAANFALNDWGEAVFRELALSYVALQRRQVALETSNARPNRRTVSQKKPL